MTKGKPMSPIDLLQINVNEHTEKKNGLTYLSWAWAWAKVLIADPKAIYEVQFFQSQDGKPQCYMDVNGTAMVWVTVTMFGKPIACQLPVMDYRNKPIPKPDAFAVNTAIMRCLTKAIALHGLGLYIYAGEDMPEEVGNQEESGKLPGVTPEATEKVEQIVKKAIKTVVEGGDLEDANATLFGEAIIEYLKLNETEADLKSYWKKNQEKLDSLKVTHPTLYGQVKSRFTAAKEKLKSKETT